jgi:hypothetical protein
MLAFRDLLEIQRVIVRRLLPVSHAFIGIPSVKDRVRMPGPIVLEIPGDYKASESEVHES